MQRKITAHLPCPLLPSPLRMLTSQSSVKLCWDLELSKIAHPYDVQLL